MASTSLADPNSPKEPRRGSVSCAQLLGGAEVTIEHLENQAAGIVKTRAQLAEREESQSGTLTPTSSGGAQRINLMRKMEGLARSFSESFTATRGPLKRGISMGGRRPPKISGPFPAIRLTREKEKAIRRILHTRIMTYLTTNLSLNDITIKIISLYMTPDFPIYIFDELTALRILEAIVIIISPPVSRNPLAKSCPRQTLSTPFREARREAFDATHRLWTVLCKNRASRGEKAPRAEVKTKVISLAIMAQLWPRGVLLLGFRDHVGKKCADSTYGPFPCGLWCSEFIARANAGGWVDSWGFEFCTKATKETLGCGIFGFLIDLGTFDDEMMQPSKADLKANGIIARDFAHEEKCSDVGCGEETIDAMMEFRGWNGILDG